VTTGFGWGKELAEGKRYWPGREKLNEGRFRKPGHKEKIQSQSKIVEVERCQERRKLSRRYIEGLGENLGYIPKKGRDARNYESNGKEGGETLGGGHFLGRLAKEEYLRREG